MNMLKSLRYGKEFEELYTGNYSRLYYYAYQFLNDAEVSRDVVNDAFEYVWKNYENFRKMNVVAILFQSVRNKSIDTFRQIKWKRITWHCIPGCFRKRRWGWMRKARRLNGYIKY